MTREWRAAAALVLAAGVGLAGCGGDDAAGPDEGPTTSTVPAATTTSAVPAATPEELAAAVCAGRRIPGRLRLAEAELSELSGLVALDSGLWAHNDSGDEARVFRLDEAGVTRAVVRLEGVEALDWEDLSGAGPSAGELFVGDIGDNDAQRAEVLVHRFAVPEPPPTGEVTIPADEIQTIVLRYPDGARDAEALLVDPVSRDLVIVHKRYGGASEVYQAAEGDWSDGEATLELVGTVAVGDTPLDAVTAGDVGYDGRVVALRTYAAVLVFARQDDRSLAEALVAGPTCDAPAPVEVQGEAIAFTPTGYLTISEGDRPRLNTVTVTVPAPGE